MLIAHLMFIFCLVAGSNAESNSELFQKRATCYFKNVPLLKLLIHTGSQGNKTESYKNDSRMTCCCVSAVIM